MWEAEAARCGRPPPWRRLPRPTTRHAPTTPCPPQVLLNTALLGPEQLAEYYIQARGVGAVWGGFGGGGQRWGRGVARVQEGVQQRPAAMLSPLRATLARRPTGNPRALAPPRHAPAVVALHAGADPHHGGPQAPARRARRGRRRPGAALGARPPARPLRHSPAWLARRGRRDQITCFFLSPIPQIDQSWRKHSPPACLPPACPPARPPPRLLPLPRTERLPGFWRCHLRAAPLSLPLAGSLLVSGRHSPATRTALKKRPL
jgi:hypothetical protein